MVEGKSTGSKTSFRVTLIIVLMVIYFAAVIIVGVLLDELTAYGLLFSLGIIWICQILTVGDDPDVSARASLTMAIWQSIGIGFLFVWITALWWHLPFTAFGGEDLDARYYSLVLAGAGMVGAVASFLANRSMGRYMFTAVFTLVAYAGMVPACLKVIDENMALMDKGFVADAAIYIVMIPVWSIAPIAYLIRYNLRYRAYRKALFIPGHDLQSARVAPHWPAFEEMENMEDMQ